jgi:hypothetical protein
MLIRVELKPSKSDVVSHAIFSLLPSDSQHFAGILPLNVVNEKIYIFLWFWFIFLTIVTAMTVMYRIVIIFSPRMRVYLLRLRFR